jgi:hypothetical protein
MARMYGKEGRKHSTYKYVPRLRKKRISLAAIYPSQPHLISRVSLRDKEAPFSEKATLL